MKKLAPFLSLLILLVASCTAEPIQSEPNSLEIVPESLFMSGELNGFPYANLKPLAYLDASSSQTTLETYVTPLTSHKYLVLQGTDMSLNGSASTESILINIRIPESQWAVGVYQLKDDVSFPMNGLNSCVSLVEAGAGNKTKSLSGTIVITEFDPIGKRIKGNFSFTYFRENDTFLEQPLTFNNGTFNYKLDDPYFN